MALRLTHHVSDASRIGTMNLRTTLVLPLALLISATAIPTAATASTTTRTGDPSECVVALVLPKTLAITGYSTPYGARMTGQLDCFFHATWDVSEGLISTGRVIDFYSPNTSGFMSWTGAPATVHALPRMGAYSYKTYTDPTTGATGTYTVVEDPSSSMTVKYDSRIAWGHASRRGTWLTLRASAAQFSVTPSWQPGYVVWPNAEVRFQKLAHGKWRTVKTVRTNAKGNASATVRATRGTWRVSTATTSSVWGKTSGSHAA